MASRWPQSNGIWFHDTAWWRTNVGKKLWSQQISTRNRDSFSRWISNKVICCYGHFDTCSIDKVRLGFVGRIPMMRMTSDCNVFTYRSPAMHQLNYRTRIVSSYIDIKFYTHYLVVILTKWLILFPIVNISPANSRPKHQDFAIAKLRYSFAPLSKKLLICNPTIPSFLRNHISLSHNLNLRRIAIE